MSPPAVLPAALQHRTPPVGQGDATPYKNVYVFRFVLRGGLMVSVDKYANPVTYAKLAGLPIGERRCVAAR